MNSNVINAKYAVRGDIVKLANKISKELDTPGGELPFTKLLEAPQVERMFSADVVAQARQLMKVIPGGMGAYSDSAGVPLVRKMVSEAIQRRDGHPSSAEDIFMTAGASQAVHYMMEVLLKDGRDDAVMVPIPQYPLYSATLKLYGGKLVPYYLDESSGWGLNVNHLKTQLAAAREAGTCVRGLVIINPGNPTGQCLSYENQEDVVRFCKEEQLVLIADEVYQTNIYDESKKFFSFKKVACDMGEINDIQLVSLHSISKGFVGECGRRGGYMELSGFLQPVCDQIIELVSISLCPNHSGQICCALMMNPPEEGTPSYTKYHQETQSILESLKRRAELLVAALNKLEGVTCNIAEGAMYAFPKITLPQRAIDEAKKIGKSPDFFYCWELLQQYGVLVVPGSGFGQAEGTFHFRTTFLPSEEDIVTVVEKVTEFHAKFMAQYK